MDPAVFGKSINLKLGNFSFSPSYLQAGAILLLTFLLLLSIAQIRRHFIDWSVKGAVFGVFIGFLLALIFEGFLVVGGRTALTELLGWENPPKPIANFLDVGRAKLVNVLGITDKVPSSEALTNPTADDAVEILQTLDPTEMRKVKTLICAP